YSRLLRPPGSTLFPYTTLFRSQDYGLLALLFPETVKAIDEGESDELIRQALRNTDARIAQGKSVTPYFLFAAMLWPALQAEWRRDRKSTRLNSSHVKISYAVFC